MSCLEHATISSVVVNLKLLRWLFKTVFPTNSKFEDNMYAQRLYNDVIDHSITSGYLVVHALH